MLTNGELKLESFQFKSHPLTDGTHYIAQLLGSITAGESGKEGHNLALLLLPAKLYPFIAAFLPA